VKEKDGFPNTVVLLPLA